MISLDVKPHYDKEGNQIGFQVIDDASLLTICVCESKQDADGIVAAFEDQHKLLDIQNALEEFNVPNADRPLIAVIEALNLVRKTSNMLESAMDYLDKIRGE
jgi:hypothetical protein